MPDAGRAPRLDAETLHDVVGPRPNPHQLAMIEWDVRIAVRALEREIASGSIAPGVRRVHGRRLADWLDLTEVARLYRLWRDRGTPTVDPDADLRRALEAEAAQPTDHGLTVADLPRATHGTPSKRRRSA